MSTKTTIKRIALVAVAALGLGGLTAVTASANAGKSAASITIGSATSFKAGAWNYIPVTVTLASGFAAGDTVTVTAQITAAPTTGGNANTASTLGTGSGAAANATTDYSTAAKQGTQFYIATDSIGTKGTVDATLGAAATGNTAFANLTSTSTTYHLAGSRDASVTGLSVGAAGDVAAAAIITPFTSATTLSQTYYLAVKPDLAGSYSVLVATNATGRTVYSAGDTSATATFATTGSVASVTLASMNTSPVGSTAGYGVVLKATLKDAAGNITNLGALDSIKFTSTDTADSFTACGNAACSSALTGGTATQGMFTNGVGFFKVTNSGSASTVSTITATGSGTLPTTVTSTVGATFKALIDLGDAGSAEANRVTEGLGSSTAGYNSGATTVSSTANWTQYIDSTATSSKLKYTLNTKGIAAAAALTATGYTAIKITDDSTYKSIFGASAQVGISYFSVCAITAGDSTVSTFTCSISHAALGNGLASLTATMATEGASNVGVATGHDVTITGSKAITAGTNTITASPAGPINATAAGVVKIAATLKDQFKNAFPAGVAVTAAVTGRNTVATTNLVTDANGMVSFSYTDAGTTATNDTVTFTNTSSGTATANVTVTYSTTAVKTVTISGGNYSAGVLLQTTQTKDISAGDGAEAGAVSITATVKDANGSLMVGVPVTFGITGTGVAITSTTASGYTDGTGVATASVYAWLTGTYTYTATAGGVVSTGTITFGQTAKGEERTVSVSSNGNGIVTAKVVDRFGNPVPGVTIYGTGTTGLVINSKTKDSGTSATDGTVDFVVSGSGTFTASTIDWAAAAGSYGSGQTSAPKGYLYNSTSATTLATYVFTAYTAGTALADEEGVGASFDAAGVATATVDVASTTASDSVDAANEATDAANAATDAANAAAEAADAATAAAQDAQAAVAALATQVASLIAGIKAQITTLTNLVIKIQKKVRA